MAKRLTVKTVALPSWENRLFTIMEEGAPASAKLVFERFREVMNDKYRLADKFLVIASVLNAEDAEADAKEFRRLKTFRDHLLHGLDIQLSRFPTNAVQKLLLKYLKLHVMNSVQGPEEEINIF